MPCQSGRGISALAKPTTLGRASPEMWHPAAVSRQVRESTEMTRSPCALRIATKAQQIAIVTIPRMGCVQGFPHARHA